MSVKYLAFANTTQTTARNVEVATQKLCGPLTTRWYHEISNVDGRQSFFVTDGGINVLTTGEIAALTDTPWEQVSLPNPCYVAVNGTRAGAGTIGDPTLIEVAFTALSTIVNGTEIIVVPGEYIGSFVLYKSGVALSRNKVSFQDGAKIRGSLTVYADYCDIVGVYVYGTPSSRWTNETGSAPALMYSDGSVYKDGITLYGHNTKIIHSTIHDDFNGGSFWQNAINSTVYGSLIYNNGWGAPDRGHGHAIYAQNESGTKRLEQIVMGLGYGGGLRVYGSQGPIVGFTIKDCVHIGDRFICGGSQPASDLHIDGSVFFDSYLEMGLINRNNVDVEIKNCIVRGYTVGAGIGLFSWWDSITIHDNIFIMNGTGINNNLGLFAFVTDGGEVYDIDYNTYYYTNCKNPVLTMIDYSTGSQVVNYLSISEWQALGRDVHSTFINAIPGNQVSVKYSSYDSDKGVVSIMNFEGLATVNVSLSGGSLTNGRTYRLYNTMNPAEYQEFVYSGAVVPVAMGGWTVATPYGAAAPLLPSYAPGFMCFALDSV